MTDLTYPNRVNTQGIPTLAGTPKVETIGTVATLVIEFNPHLALNDNWSGLFLVCFTAPVPGSTNPVVFATKGESGNTPLYLYSGSQAVANDIDTTGTNSILECFWNNDTRRLQLIAML